MYAIDAIRRVCRMEYIDRLTEIEGPLLSAFVSSTDCLHNTSIYCEVGMVGLADAV